MARHYQLLTDLTVLTEIIEKQRVPTKMYHTPEKTLDIDFKSNQTFPFETQYPRKYATTKEVTLKINHGLSGEPGLSGDPVPPSDPGFPGESRASGDPQFYVQKRTN